MNEEILEQMKLMNVILFNIYVQFQLKNSSVFTLLGNDEFKRFAKAVDEKCGDVFDDRREKGEM